MISLFSGNRRTHTSTKKPNRYKVAKAELKLAWKLTAAAKEKRKSASLCLIAQEPQPHIWLCMCVCVYVYMMSKINLSLDRAKISKWKAIIIGADCIDAISHGILAADGGILLERTMEGAERHTHTHSQTSPCRWKGKNADQLRQKRTHTATISAINIKIPNVSICNLLFSLLSVIFLLCCSLRMCWLCLAIRIKYNIFLWILKGFFRRRPLCRGTQQWFLSCTSA